MWPSVLNPHGPSLRALGEPFSVSESPASGSPAQEVRHGVGDRVAPAGAPQTESLLSTSSCRKCHSPSDKRSEERRVKEGRVIKTAAQCLREAV